MSDAPDAPDALDAPDAIDTSDWDRLPKRMVLVQAVRLALSLLPAAIVFLFFGELPGLGLVIGIVAAMSFGAIRDLVNVFTTRYLIDDARVQLRTGLFTTSHLSIPRDRVRAVDVTARPLHRIVGLAVVRIGTGEQARPGAGGELTLDAIHADAAERLRVRLLAAAVAPALDMGGAVDQPESTIAQPTTLSRLRWHWLGWSLLSWWTLLLPGVLIGSGYQVLGSLGIDVEDLDVVDTAVDAVRSASIALLVGAGVVGVLLVGIVARIGTFIETWWGFVLQREADGTLRTQRGLFTNRSTSLQEERIRGVQLDEPVLLRPFAVGSAQVVTTGVARETSGATAAGSTSLGPPARLGEVDAVVAAVLREATTPARGAPLTPHPRAALRRLLFRAATVSLVAWIALALVPVLAVELATPTLVLLVAVGVTVAALAAAVAVDGWRSLGHRLTPRHVVMRRGVLVRRTVALEHAGVIGWIGTRTYFQRRVGLMTLTATTAAGSAAYAIVDLDPADGIALADSALPGLLTPFLQRPGDG